VANMVIAFHASTSPLDTIKVVELTAVGAMLILVMVTVLLERDVPISEMTHGTVKINMILINAQLDGYVTHIKVNASLVNQVRDMDLLILAKLSANMNQTVIKLDGDAIFQTIPVKNVIQKILLVKQM